MRRLTALLLLLGSCAPNAPRVVVQLVSDYTPGRDFDAISVSYPGHSEQVDAARDHSYGRAARIAELVLASSDRLTVTVSLLLRGGVVQAQPRRVLPRSGNTTVVTFLITRDCAGVSCPDASDADAIACVGGRCTNPECSPEHPELCPPCAGGCSASLVPCAENTCRAEGVCFAEPHDERCPAGQICSANDGCRDLATDAGTPDDAAAPDAGAPDAGTDAGLDAAMPDAAIPDAAPTPDANVSCTAGAIRFDELGSGTIASPYLLCNLAQWDSFAAVGDPTVAYRLQADLAITNSPTMFAGVFDGAGHTLSGPNRSVSLFGMLSHATIRDLRVSIGVGLGSLVDDVGVIAASALDTTFDGVQVGIRGVVFGGDRVGGLAGSMVDCLVTNCAISIDRMIGDTNVGLVAGAMIGGSIQRVSVASLQFETRGTADCVSGGGLVGSATGVTIDECDVSVSMAPMGAGGFGGAVGVLTGLSRLSDVRVLGGVPDVAAGSMCDVGVGGIAGLLNGGASITRAYLIADTRGGGLVGDAIDGSVTDSVVVGPHAGFPALVFRRCTAATTTSGVHYYDDGTPASAPVGCSPPDLGHALVPYFDDPSSDPLSRWDFTLIWEVGPTYPSLRRAPPLP